MNKLLVQKFLETNTFGELEDQHGVEASFDKQSVKFSLNYNMINAKDDDKLSQQTRGLILASVSGKSFASEAKMVNGRLSFKDVCPGETSVIAYGFDRFFNAGQVSAAKIDWNDPKLAVLEKKDGTLIDAEVAEYLEWDMEEFYKIQKAYNNSYAVNIDEYITESSGVFVVVYESSGT